MSQLFAYGSKVSNNRMGMSYVNKLYDSYFCLVWKAKVLYHDNTYHVCLVHVSYVIRLLHNI